MNVFATLALFIVLLSSDMPVAAAQSYPNRPVKILVGGVAGSVPDALVRPVAERLAGSLGQPVVVENRPGAAGILAMEALVRSAPDGYTLAVSTMSQAVFNPYLFSKLPYDPLRDLEAVAPLATGAMVLAANTAFEGTSLRDVVEIAKCEPGRLFIAMPQNGAPPHIVALLLNRSLGITPTMVPHKSGAEAIAAVISGQIPLVIEAPTLIAPQVRAGRLKAILVTGRERERELPDVPTARELGLAVDGGAAWIGLVAPKGTPKAIVDRLNRELARVLGTPDMQAMLDRMSFRPLRASPDEFTATIVRDHARWSEVIRSANLRLD